MNSIEGRWLLYPLLAMALLTFAVGVLTYRPRVAEIRRKGVRLQSIASSAGMAATLEDTRASDNFRRGERCRRRGRPGPRRGSGADQGEPPVRRACR